MLAGSLVSEAETEGSRAMPFFCSSKQLELANLYHCIISSEREMGSF